MADGADPSVQRRRLALELRRGRDAAGLTQRDAAREIEWSLSKLIRIESGAQGISVTDLNALLALYGVTDPDQVATLATAARGSRGQSWWNGYRDIVSPQFAQLLGHETQAASVRVAHPFLIPGLLQTEEYAAALMDVYRDHGRGKRIINLRMERQERLFGSGAEALFVIGEEALHRWIGGPDVLRHQVKHLLDISQRTGTAIRIVPFRAGSHPGLQSPFTLLRLRETDEEVLFLESINGDDLARDEPDQIAEYGEYFETMYGIALSHEDGDALLGERIDLLSHARETDSGGTAG
jgi:transcriptional regulator with XRE-family HTH domain